MNYLETCYYYYFLLSLCYESPIRIKMNWKKLLFLGSMAKWLFLGFLSGLFQQIVVITFIYYRDIV